MFKIIEVREDEFDDLTECTEKMLHYGGKVMGKLENMKRRRGRMQERRDDDEEEMMGERRAWDYRQEMMPRVQFRDGGHGGYREMSQQRFRDDGESYTPEFNERGGMRYGRRG